MANNVQAPTGFDDRGIPRGARRVKPNVSGGIATILSNTAAIDVVNAYVNSGDVIHLTAAPSTFGAVTSNHGIICVRSINPGVGFVIGNNTAVNFPWPVDVHWLIHKQR